MVVRAAQDPFGLGRLSQSIRQNRAEQRQTGIDQQQAVTRDLQQQLLGGQVQQQQQGLADLAAGWQLKTDLQAATEKDTGESRTLKAINFLKQRAPDEAQALINKTIGTAGNIARFSGQGAIDFVNTELGTKWKLDAEDNETITIDQGDKKVLINKASGEVVKEFPVTAKTGSAGGDLQKTGAFLVKDDEGNTSIAVGVFDKTSGDLKTETTVIPNANLVSKLGETGAEQTERKIGQKQQEVRVKEEEERAGELIERGTLAAESTATLRRAIGLLDDIKTGGFENVKLRAKQLLGIESADEGELSNSLGKAVLSQLRETFGAAFTENEGNRLARIEASFGKSTEANKRLLKQALSIAERTAKRARKKAVDREDSDTVADIDELLSFSLSGDKKPQAKQVSELSDEEILEGLNAN